MPATGLPWLLIAAYIVAAVSCLRAFHAGRLGARLATRVPADIERRRAGRDRDNRLRVAFWAMLGLTLVLIGIDRQLGVMTQLTELVRQSALDDGWYDRRRMLQLVLVLVAACVAGIGFTVTLARTRRRLPQHAPALIGGFAIALLLAARVVSYHHLDAVLHIDLGPFTIGVALEATAIAIVTACAWRRTRWIAELRRVRTEQPPSISVGVPVHDRPQLTLHR
jgi:hypothetical protein